MDSYIWKMGAGGGNLHSTQSYEELNEMLKEEVLFHKANPLPPDHPFYSAYVQQLRLLEYLITLDEEEITRIFQHIGDYSALLTKTVYEVYPNPMMVSSVLRQAYLFGYMVGACKDVPEPFTKE